MSGGGLNHDKMWRSSSPACASDGGGLNHDKMWRSSSPVCASDGGLGRSE